MQINSRWFSQWQLCLVLKKHSLTSLIYSLLLRNRNSCLMILLHFDGEKQCEIQTNFQVKKSGSRQIREKKHLGIRCVGEWGYEKLLSASGLSSDIGRRQSYCLWVHGSHIFFHRTFGPAGPDGKLGVKVLWSCAFHIDWRNQRSPSPMDRKLAHKEENASSCWRRNIHRGRCRVRSSPGDSAGSN